LVSPILPNQDVRSSRLIDKVAFEENLAFESNNAAAALETVIFPLPMIKAAKLAAPHPATAIKKHTINGYRIGILDEHLLRRGQTRNGFDVGQHRFFTSADMSGAWIPSWILSWEEKIPPAILSDDMSGAWIPSWILSWEEKIPPAILSDAVISFAQIERGIEVKVIRWYGGAHNLHESHQRCDLGNECLIICIFSLRDYNLEICSRNRLNRAGITTLTAFCRTAPNPTPANI
jgi:hypothetical protein